VNSKEFARYVQRDSYCLHCGETEAIAPNHRINRGMGGSKKRNNPANIVVICSELNGLIESDFRLSELAKHYGYKLESWEEPKRVAVLDTYTGSWWLLDDYYGRTLVEGRDN